MIIFILVHKHLRKTLDIIDIANRNSGVDKIYLVISKDTKIIDKKLRRYLEDNPCKISEISHQNKGIKGAWIKAIEIGIAEDSDFLIFENDVVPTNFFLDYSKLAFSFYRNESSFFGFTGYSPKKSIKMTISLDTFLSFRFGSWSFATYPRVARDFIMFIKNTSSQEIGKILWKNRFKIGKDTHAHYLSDQNLNRNLFGYIWVAFMISKQGLWLYPAEHLVSCFGNDKYAINQSSGKDIISKYNNVKINDVKINFTPVNKFSKRYNKKIINFYYPNIIQRIINRTIKRISMK